MKWNVVQNGRMVKTVQNKNRALAQAMFIAKDIQVTAADKSRLLQIDNGFVVRFADRQVVIVIEKEKNGI